ncbi:type II secretion system F family protein [Pirellulales bacterium]|nr:type II secretion system F family protein [Pirellulales bacterium]
MPDFAYTARNVAGDRVEGTLSANSQREALAALAARDLFPLQIAVAKAGDAAALGFKFGSKRVTPQAAARFYTQMAALLRSGVPLLRSLEVIRDQSSNAALREVVDDLQHRVSEGESLAEAMARHPRAFDNLSRSIVRAGGEGGFLEEALERVAKFTDQQAELKSRVMGAMAYPIFLAVFGTVIVAILIVYFVPQFDGLFSRLRQQGQLPLLTDALLAFSRNIGKYGTLIVAGVIGAVLLIRSRIATPEGRRMLDGWKIRLPQAGTIYRNLAVARFCRVLGTLLSGGVPIVRALTISADSTGNRILAEAVSEAAENITAGESLAAPLKASGHFPANVVEMIAVAEQSNTLETVLTNVADSLERETWRRLDLFVRLLEPVMLLLLASAVLVVVIALLLPMLNSAMAM